MDRKVTSIKISPDIWKKAKIFALERNLSISQLVETALLHEMQR